MQKLISRSKVISRLLQEMNGIKDSYSNVVADVGFSNENINGDYSDDLVVDEHGGINYGRE